MTTYLSTHQAAIRSVRDEAATGNHDLEWLGYNGNRNPVYFIRNNDGTIWAKVCYKSMAEDIVARNARDATIARLCPQSVEWVEPS